MFLKHNIPIRAINNFAKHSRRYGNSLGSIDELSQMMGDASCSENMLRSFLQSCDGIIFSCREDVVHTLSNKIDSHLLTEDYRKLLSDLELDIHKFNPVFSEFEIWQPLSI